VLRLLWVPLVFLCLPIPKPPFFFLYWLCSDAFSTPSCQWPFSYEPAFGSLPPLASFPYLERGSSPFSWAPSFFFRGSLLFQPCLPPGGGPVFFFSPFFFCVILFFLFPEFFLSGPCTRDLKTASARLGHSSSFSGTLLGLPTYLF